MTWHLLQIYKERERERKRERERERERDINRKFGVNGFEFYEVF